MSLTKLLTLFSLTCIGFISGCTTNPVTGQSELAVISQNQEIQIGERFFKKGQNESGGLYTQDANLSHYVTSVGNRIARVSDRPDLPYEFVIVNDVSPNAWSMPGGKIAINKGLLVILDNEAELAAVLAHEIVHAAARHSARRQERNILLQTGLIVLSSVFDGGGSPVIGDVAGLGTNVVTNQYSQADEMEADYYGMHYLARAGYDPHAAVTLQETFIRLTKVTSGPGPIGILSTHPPSKARLDANMRTLDKLPKGGKIGRFVYQQKIRHLKNVIRKEYKNYKPTKTYSKKSKQRKKTS